jgi:glutaredoxin
MEIPQPLVSGFTVYSKSDCSYCDKVKKLLEEGKTEVKLVNCDEFLLADKPAFLKEIETLAKKEHKTFPMVFLNGQFLGGFTETLKVVMKMEEDD